MPIPKALQYQKRKAPPADKGSDGLLPSKQSGAVKHNTAATGHGMTNQGTTARASRGSDGTPMTDGHMDESMTGGPPGRSSSGPNHGKAFHKKFDVSAASQALRKRSRDRGYLPGGY